MKVRALASNTFRGLLHNKLVIVALIPISLFFLIGVVTIIQYKRMTTGANLEQLQIQLMQSLEQNRSLLISVGSVLASWAVADAITTDIKTGAILAIMARPIHRWQYLVGKYLGTMMLMVFYTIGALAATTLLMRLDGLPLYTPPWILIAYPLVRYAIWMSIAIFLTNWMNPALVLGTTSSMSLLNWLSTQQYTRDNVPNWILAPFHFALPLTSVVLSEDRFLAMTQAGLRRYPWIDHLTALSYGADYSFVFLLLAAVAFRNRSLARG